MKIKNIFWERVNLHIVVDEEIKGEVYLSSNKNEIKLNYKNNEIIINVTNTPEGVMLDKGKYVIKYNNEVIKVSSSILNILEDKSKIFRYKNGTCCYIVFFEIDDDMCFKINTNFMIENYKYKKFFTLSEGRNAFKKMINLSSF